jgi:hypothetical protein
MKAGMGVDRGENNDMAGVMHVFGEETGAMLIAGAFAKTHVGCVSYTRWRTSSAIKPHTFSGNLDPCVIKSVSRVDAAAHANSISTKTIILFFVFQGREYLLYIYIYIYPIRLPRSYTSQDKRAFQVRSQLHRNTSQINERRGVSKACMSDDLPFSPMVR